MYGLSDGSYRRSQKGTEFIIVKTIVVIIRSIILSGDAREAV